MTVSQQSPSPGTSPFKAKQGYCVYRVRVKRGDRKKRVAKVGERG